MDINATLIGQTVAFLVFVLFCYKFVWPPLIEAIEKRQKEIADSISNAKATKEEVDREKSKAAIEIDKAKLLSKQLISEAERQAAKIIEDAQVQAQFESNRIKEQAKKDLAQEKTKIAKELRSEVSNLAITIAEKIVQEELKDKDYSDIINNALEKL